MKLPDLRLKLAPSRWAQMLIEFLAILAVLQLGALAFRAPREVTLMNPDLSAPEPMKMDPCDLKTAGYLRGRLYGALDQTIAWQGSEMKCGGMTRPNNEGIRLVFTSPASDDDDGIVFIIGIDGELETLVATERPANITIIDELNDRWFGTGGMDRCWTTVADVELVTDEKIRSYRVEGVVYCAGALPSLSDASSVTLSDFLYSGKLTLDDAD